jgi:hypothetical protein
VERLWLAGVYFVIFVELVEWFQQIKCNFLREREVSGKIEPLSGFFRFLFYFQCITEKLAHVESV